MRVNIKRNYPQQVDTFRKISKAVKVKRVSKI